MKREGDMAAVVEAYQAPLLRYAAHLLHNAADADDVVQKVFVKCVAYWDGEMKPSDDLAAWLFRVTRNAALDHLRGEKRRALMRLKQADGAEEAQEPSADISDEAAAAAAAMRTVLNERERQLVTLKVYEEKSYKEISDITGMAVGYVGVALHNAMKKLAEHLKKRREGGHEG